MRSRLFALAVALLAHGCVSGDADDDFNDPAWDQADDPSEPPDTVDETPDLTEEVDLDPEAEPEDDPPITTIASSHQYQNPVSANCADPGVIRVDSADGPTFFAACTGGGFPMFKSSDLVHWSSAGHIFDAAHKPAWADGNSWAPEIHHVGAGYVAYFAALSSSRKKMCIGAARATTVDGPYTDLGHPLVCDSHVGLIDPNLFTTASGRHILYYKTDSNALRPQEHTIIYGQELTADGIHLTGARHRLLKNTLAWEGDVVEAPWVMQRGKYFYMFYSGFRFCNNTYGVGVARALSPLGPFTKRGAPILHSNAKWGGPGHNSVVRAAGHYFMVYHAWAGSHSCGEDGHRELLVDRITWSGGWPFVNSGSPSRGVHTAPLFQQ